MLLLQTLKPIGFERSYHGSYKLKMGFSVRAPLVQHITNIFVLKHLEDLVSTSCSLLRNVTTSSIRN